MIYNIALQSSADQKMENQDVFRLMLHFTKDILTKMKNNSAKLTENTERRLEMMLL
jgi:hypothetical protein